ncbi:hypothetical protein RB623_29795 [Mesorhizobium sp. LHD-90]|uniref:hypothetical protein n=1 Tax=Mesorhizobium sp. LHD-90 TaxID=3071414 RepID=UPI0027E19117|nr:hypothetical protein [Mesorhizobium sp. LHD-90]MDQ6438263.1 hypothetical protein [Mesorhizobium sp. LHD-90]
MKYYGFGSALFVALSLSSSASADQATATPKPPLAAASAPATSSSIEQHCIMVAAKAETDARAKNSDDPVGAAYTALNNCRIEKRKNMQTVNPKPVN